MENTALKSAYGKILTLPEDAQKAAAAALEDIAAAHEVELFLNAEQTAELERRMENKSKQGRPHDEVMARMRTLFKK